MVDLDDNYVNRFCEWERELSGITKLDKAQGEIKRIKLLEYPYIT